MILDQIEALAQVLERVPRLTEIEIRSEGASLRLRRGGALPAPAPVAPPAPADTVPADAVAEPIRVRAGVVGVFHAAERAVEVGERVREGQTLGQIETMRIDNDCKAPAAGRVLAVHVHDGQPVEYGQLLFDIAPETLS